MPTYRDQRNFSTANRLEIAKKHSAIVDGLIKFGILFSAIISIVDESTFFFDVLFYSIWSLFGLAIVLTIVWSIKGQFSFFYILSDNLRNTIEMFAVFLTYSLIQFAIGCERNGILWLSMAAIIIICSIGPIVLGNKHSISRSEKSSDDAK